MKKEHKVKKIKDVVVVQGGKPNLLSGLIPLLEESSLPNPALLENGIGIIDITNNKLLVSYNGSWIEIPDTLAPIVDFTDLPPHFRFANQNISRITQDATSYYIAGSFNGVLPHVTPGLGGVDDDLEFSPLPGMTTGFLGVSGSNSSREFVINGNFIYMAGAYTHYNDAPCSRLTKLNLTTGQLDSTFHYTTSGLNLFGLAQVHTLDSNKLFVSIPGASAVYRGTTVTGNMFAVNATNGDYDGSVNFSRFNGNVADALIYDNSLYAVGQFTQYNSTVVNRIVKISLATGELDSSFNVAASGFIGNPARIIVDEDTNSLYVAGAMTSYNGVSINRIVKVDADSGVRDSSFVTTTGAATAGTINDLLLLNGDLFVGGTFTAYNGVSTRLIKVDKFTNTTNATFNSVSGFINPALIGQTTSNVDVKSLVLDNSNNLIVLGSFNSYKDSISQGIIKLDSTTGTVLKTCNPGFPGTSLGKIKKFGNKYYVSGESSIFGGTLRYGVAKLNKTTFELDETFNPPPIVSGAAALPVTCVQVDDDGVYVSYDGTISGNTQYKCLAKLDKITGAVLPFATTTGGLIRDMTVTPNYLYVCGDSSLTFSGVSGSKYLYRVNLTTDTVDLTFSGFTGSTDLTAIAVSSGNIYAAGQMATYSGVSTTKRLVKISETTQARDNTFYTNLPAGLNSNASQLLIDSGNLYVLGLNTSVSGAEPFKVSATTGIRDVTFNPDVDSGMGSNVRGLILDNNLYCIGSFSSYNGNNQIRTIVKMDKNTAVADTGFKNYTIDQGGFGGVSDIIVTISGDLLIVCNRDHISGYGYSRRLAKSFIIDETTGDIIE